MTGDEGEGAASVVVASTVLISTGSLVVKILNLPNRFVNTPGVVTLSEVVNDAVDCEVGDVVLVAVTVVVTASVVVKVLLGIVVSRGLAVVKIFPRPINILEPLLLVIELLVGSEDLGASTGPVDDELCGPNTELLGVTGVTVVDDLLVEGEVILATFSMSGSRVEIGMVWGTGWSTGVVVNTPLPKLLRPLCLPKLLRPNLGDRVG